jgi:phosphoserine phosphatase
VQFFRWEIEQRLIPEEVIRWAQARYEEYLAARVSEEAICGEMVQIHAGLSERRLEQAAEQFYSERIEAKIFLEMRELVARLQAGGCDIWAVSSTNEWVVRAGVRRFGIPPERVLGACVAVENGCATDRLIRHCSGEGKAEALREFAGPPRRSLRQLGA